ncbi:MAG: 50S ribosomal protein L25 [Anaerolineaceae bacterium]
MDKVVLHALPRTIKGKQVSAIRRQGQLPAVIYGHHFDATPITLNLKEATKQLIGLTPTTLVYVELEGMEHATLVREKQRNYIRNTIIHVDFQAVSLKEKIRAGIMIELTGLSPAVKDFNAIVMNGTSIVHVEGLPQDLPEHLVVDLSVLKNIGDVIRVKDLAISDKITVLTDIEEMVALITMPQQEAEEVVVEEVAAEGEPEVIEKGKKEEEEAK